MEFQTSNGVILSLPKSDINEEIVFGDLKDERFREMIRESLRVLIDKL